MSKKRRNILPCPFCGSNFVQCDNGDTRSPFLFFRCRNPLCGAVVSFANEVCDTEPEKAVDWWNSRAGMSIKDFNGDLTINMS